MIKAEVLLFAWLFYSAATTAAAESKSYLLTDPNNTSMPQIYVEIGEQETISHLVRDANDILLSGMYFKEILEKAQKGDIDAQIRLGYLYATGKSVEQNPKESLKWYRKAADGGSAVAQHYIGQVYQRGYFGLRQNPKEAVRWYRKAADQGFVQAQLDLGQSYHWGINGVEPNKVEAVYWLTKAAQQNNVEAQCEVASLHEDNEEYEKAQQWYQKAAQQGDIESQNNLAMMYYQGRGVKQDYKEAMKWFTKMAERGDSRGWVGLGIMYATGQGVEKNIEEAETCFNKAAEQKVGFDLDLLFQLGLQHVHGEGVKQDAAEGFKWILKAAQMGYLPAQYYVGTLYLQGMGVKLDFEEALSWFRKAAEQGNSGAEFNLGMMYANGQGVARDYIEAYKWLWLSSGMNEDGTVNSSIPRPHQKKSMEWRIQFTTEMGLYAPDALKQLKNIEKHLTPEQKSLALQKAREIKDARIQYLREHYGYKSPEELQKIK